MLVVPDGENRNEFPNEIKGSMAGVEDAGRLKAPSPGTHTRLTGRGPQEAAAQGRFRHLPQDLVQQELAASPWP